MLVSTPCSGKITTGSDRLLDAVMKADVDQTRTTRALIFSYVVLVLTAGLASLVEIILVKASEYRLSHGDGRERSFRSGDRRVNRAP